MIKEFEDAVNGADGDFDAWLECNNEAECLDAIKPIIQERDTLRAALQAHGEETAKLIAERDELLAALRLALTVLR